MSEPSREEVPAYLIRHVERLCLKQARVDSLIDLHIHLERLLGANPADNAPDKDDVLRAAVVLLHATMEDSLRTVAQEHLPRTDPDLLKSIPLVGTPVGQAVKFSLGDLVAHRGKSVEEIIGESIDQSLNRRSFNNCADLDKILQELGIDAGYCKERITELSAMMERRHRIVHQCDHLPNSNHPPTPTPIDRPMVEKWKDAVLDFLKRLLFKLQFVVSERENHGSMDEPSASSK